MESFANWLNQQLEERGWSRSEAARRGEISDSMFSKVIGGFAKPGLDFCIGVAHAFGISDVEVLRRAGLIKTPPTGTPTVQEMSEEFASLEEKDQEYILEIVRAMNARKRKSGEKTQAKEGS